MFVPGFGFSRERRRRPYPQFHTHNTRCAQIVGLLVVYFRVFGGSRESLIQSSRRTTQPLAGIRAFSPL